MTPKAEDILYDNQAEPEFSALLRRRNRRLSAAVFVLATGLVVVALLFGPPAVARFEPLLIGLFVFSSGLFAFVLVWGLLLERGRLVVRVTRQGIEAGRHRQVALRILRDAIMDESREFILLRSQAEPLKKPLMAVWKRELASPARFKEAVETVIRMARIEGRT